MEFAFVAVVFSGKCASISPCYVGFGFPMPHERSLTVATYINDIVLETLAEIVNCPSREFSFRHSKKALRQS